MEDLPSLPSGRLFYGDNLLVLRDKIPDESIDLCYIDPPFNSKRPYFQIYRGENEKADVAQTQAFNDTWRWSEAAQDYYKEIDQNQQNQQHYTQDTRLLIRGLHGMWGKSGMMAYVLAMAVRINELWKKLRPTGSFYLHCDTICCQRA